jgi:glycosyltransferase involved in cell wall biosynthesis
MPGIDVVVPCYQYGGYLRECVASVLGQGVRNMRVLIIDNASTDESVDVARQLAAEDSRVEVIARAKNLGATASYNEGLDWVSADYFALLDADDLLAPGCLQRAIACMEANPTVSFTYGIEAFRYPDGRLEIHPHHSESAEWVVTDGIDFIAEICRTPRNYVGAPTVVRRTSAQKRVGHYRPELPYTDDLEMWLRLASVGDVASISRMQGIRRIHQKQMSSDYRGAMVRDFTEREAAFESFFRQEGKTLPEAHELLAQARRSLGDHAYWSAMSHLFRGHARESGRLLKFSLARRPSAAILPPVGWLMRMDRPLERMGQIAREGVRRLGLPVKPPGAA